MLRAGGHCGIVVPGSIYTDLGAIGLRQMLFEQANVEVLISLSNEKYIFEGVHHAQKFCFLAFEKGGTTNEFPATFRINPREAVQPGDLANFIYTDTNFVRLSVDLIKRLSPDSHSVMEFKSELDVQIAEKMQFPLLGEKIEGTWNLRLCNEFHMTNDSKLFKTAPGMGRLPLYEGKMIWQFDSKYAEPKYWIIETEAQSKLGKAQQGIGFHYQDYRLAFREIASNTNERSLISSILPRQVFANHKLMVERRDFALLPQEQLFAVAVLNSFIFDFMIRQRVTTTISMYAFYQLPAPRIRSADPRFVPIVARAARLMCTTPEFDELAKEVGLGSHKKGVIDSAERARLRAELDGLVAHLYGLTESEFAHILGTFPLVAEPVKQAARNAYRDVERGLIQ